MSVKAKLRLILMADDLVVAESDDPIVWQAVLRALSSASGSEEVDVAHLAVTRDWEAEKVRLAAAALAEELQVDLPTLQAACAPKAIAPYIFLDRHHWEAFKKQTPERGRNAVSNIVLALTLLLLWAEKSGIERITIRDGGAVLKTIGARDEHPGRAVENCPWIRRWMNRLLLVPEETSKALAVARAYCTRTPPDWAEDA